MSYKGEELPCSAAHQWEKMQKQMQKQIDGLR
jgi:hypothetical protein